MGDAVVTVDLGVGMLIGDTMTQAFRGTCMTAWCDKRCGSCNHLRYSRSPASRNRGDSRPRDPPRNGSYGRLSLYEIAALCFSRDWMAGQCKGHELVEGQCHGGGMTRGDQQLLMGSPL
eukprot:1417163-Amphidinium_carterae.1